MRVIWNQRQWLEAIAAVSAAGPLAERLVIVLSERAAHDLRRAAIESGTSELGLGTRFVRADDLAAEILAMLGSEAVRGEETRRTIRVRELVRDPALALSYFPRDLLTDTPGWDAALARAICELEDAGLSPDDLPTTAAAWSDLAVLWRVLNDDAGDSWSRAQIFSSAAARLDELDLAPAVAVVTGFETVAESRFLRALCGELLCIRGARPLRAPFVNRVRALYGAAAGDALFKSRAPDRGAGSELAILSDSLFAAPQVLADPSRPQSSGRDGTVELIEHAGLEDEIDAAADWVAERMLAGERPDELAVLVPHLDPWVGLLADRIARIPWPTGEVPIAAIGGLPLARHSSGARVLAVMAALREHLRIERFAEIVPLLATGEAIRISQGAARDLAYRLGSVGGSSTEPRRALEWHGRILARAEHARDIVSDARMRQDRGDEVAVARLSSIERLERNLAALAEPAALLCDVARACCDNEPLSSIAAALESLFAIGLAIPGDGRRIVEIASKVLGELAEDPLLGEARGFAALEIIDDALRAVRLPTMRYGTAAVPIGTVASAAGLRFRSVRILGLAEGRFPASPPDDPVLTEPMRSELAEGGVAIAGRGDRALADLHRLTQILSETEHSAVFSCSRLGEERSVREPSAVLIEAASALGRGTARGTRSLRRDYTAPARRAHERFVAELSPRESAWQSRVARGAASLPVHWSDSSAIDLVRIDSLLHATDGPMTGRVDSKAVPKLPGLHAGRPLSSYRLRKVLECPHRFLFEDLLGYNQPSAPPSLRSIDPIHYGGLLHLAVERFYEVYGTSFCRRGSDLETWFGIGDGVCEVTFTEFCEEYPLVGEAVRGQELDRVKRDLREFLEYDWSSPGARAYQAVERSFGFPVPFPLPVAGRELHVRGYIDRLDLEGGKLLVRDLKSGRPHPRAGKEEDASFGLDLQLALYGIVAKELADEWGTPREVSAAYIYPRARGDLERAFHDDWPELESKGRAWLTLIVKILEERAFVRTPDRSDCRLCAFKVVCSDADVAESGEALETATGTLAEFYQLKVGE